MELSSTEFMVRIPKGMQFQRLPVIVDAGSITIHNRGWYYSFVYMGIPLAMIFIAGWVFVTSNGKDLGLAFIFFAMGAPIFLFVLIRQFAYESIRIEPSRGLLVFTFHRVLKSKSITVDFADLFIARSTVRTQDRKPRRHGLVIGVQHSGCAILYCCDKDQHTTEQAIADLPEQITQALKEETLSACILNI